MTEDPTLAELVSAHPGAARVLERHHLDYCCGGADRLAAACAERGVDPASVLDELTALGPEATPDWAAMGPAELVDHLEATHHRYLKEELPRLTALVDKVAGVHGDRHPELRDVQRTSAELRADLEPHLMKEEQVLFPMIRELDGATTAPSFHCGTLQNPIRMMLMEHDRAGELLARLRELTSGYQVPDDGCASYQALYAGLAELELDTHQHVHKENNLLFPAVLEREHQLADGRRSER
jgi:regulator of cell morphogenesis and NO signaling